MINRLKFMADVIVVGSGPGGASVARGLAGQGKKVLILERGYDHRAKPWYGTYLGAVRYHRLNLPGLTSPLNCRCASIKPVRSMPADCGKNPIRRQMF